MTRTLFCAAAMAAALSACTVNNNAPANADDNAAASVPDAASSASDAGSQEMNAIHPIPGTAGPGAPGGPPVAASIPDAFLGRWGMVPLDCTGDPSAAKGLIAIDSTTIKFYESRATLTTVTMNAPENFTGNFDFAGEGQTWTKSENLKLTNSSKTLTRTDDEGSHKYTRCA